MLEHEPCHTSTTFFAREKDSKGYSNLKSLRDNEAVFLERLKLDEKTVACLEQQCKNNNQKMLLGISEEEVKKKILNVVMNHSECEPLLDDFFANLRGKRNVLVSFISTFDLDDDLEQQILQYFKKVREDKLRRRICMAFGGTL